MFNNSIPVSSGPWKFQSWQKGVQLTVVKNDRFRAGAKMKLDRVVFRYILDTNTRFQAMKANEGQVMQSQPQLQIADFLTDKKFVVDKRPEYAFEHLDIQFGAKGHPALKQLYVRQALVTGHQPCADRFGDLPDDRSRDEGSSEPDLQAVREGLHGALSRSGPSARRR